MLKSRCIQQSISFIAIGRARSEMPLAGRRISPRNTVNYLFTDLLKLVIRCVVLEYIMNNLLHQTYTIRPKTAEICGPQLFHHGGDGKLHCPVFAVCCFIHLGKIPASCRKVGVRFNPISGGSTSKREISPVKGSSICF